MEQDVQREALTAILDEARRDVAAGRDPDEQALAERIRNVGGGKQALQQLDRVLTVARARARLAAPPKPPPAPAPRPRGRAAAFRAQPTITGNMEVRRSGSGDTVTLSWDAVRGIVAWDIRLSERRDARSEYVVREERTQESSVTTVELTLGDLPLRLHILGRAGDGRLVRRAIVSALTRENWNDRWQRRASAS